MSGGQGGRRQGVDGGAMGDLLFLAHRIPYPPDKGEKIRAWHMLRHLARHYRIHLGCFHDDPADAAHIPELARHCADLLCLRLDKRATRLRALARLRPGRSLSEAYFHDPRLQRWVAAKLAGGIDAAFVYCSAMAPYLLSASPHRRSGVPAGAAAGAAVLDMVDVDSEKWRAYAGRSGWPQRLVWAREARTLLALERRAALGFDRTLLVSQAECDRLAALAPDTVSRLQAMDNGVDLDFFSPTQVMPNPYRPGEDAVVFTGTMDYWPNVDAVRWFAAAVWPAIRARHPAARLVVVGASPAPEIARLAGPDIAVTGRVADVRPYLLHAACCIAPLRIARGIQNKVLEAMACGRPVVATPAAFEGIAATPGRDLLVAATEAALADAVCAVLDGRHPGLGPAARAAMAGYGWDASLAGLESLLRPDMVLQPA